jgi:hypothetical protein
MSATTCRTRGATVKARLSSPAISVSCLLKSGDRTPLLVRSPRPENVGHQVVKELASRVDGIHPGRYVPTPSPRTSALTRSRTGRHHVPSSSSSASCGKVDPVFRFRRCDHPEGSIGMDPKSAFHFWVRCPRPDLRLDASRAKVDGPPLSSSMLQFTGGWAMGYPAARHAGKPSRK